MQIVSPDYSLSLAPHDTGGRRPQAEAAASTGVYMLAGAGVLLILLLIVGLAVGSSE